ncbi:hypothetical protein J6590_064605 [Homalodisca vitripennis]|nr:hypothetical protein J6590_064605 [Homalodisca vitripennis]
MKESPVQVELAGQSLAVCETVKSHGVLSYSPISWSDLSFSDHEIYACQPALGRLRGLYRFRTLLPESAKLQVTGFVGILLLFSAYSNSISEENADQIQRMQNAALQFVCNVRKFDHVSVYQEAIHMIPMETVCRIQTCCLVHSVLTLNEPCSLYEKLYIGKRSIGALPGRVRSCTFLRSFWRSGNNCITPKTVQRPPL